MNAKAVLDREFFEIRAKILQIAASLDRMERGEGQVDDDPRMKLLQEGIAILSSDEPNRAEQVQLLFSRQYVENWRSEFDLPVEA